MGIHRDQLEVIRHTLEERDPDGHWLRLLEAFLPTGVADNKQLQQASGLDRYRIGRLLDKMQQAAPGGPRIIRAIEDKIPRPGVRGRGPVVYCLGEAGAALLGDAGHAGVQPCGLKDPTAIAHALATLEVRLAAVEAGLTVDTEREIAYGDNRVLRPDNRVILGDGTVALFETEQGARPALLRRIVESVQNKAAFFASPQGKRVSPAVRVLFHLARGREWERALTVWEQAVATVAQQGGGRLPFRLLAMPLGEFLERPDWSEPPADPRWEDLLDPARLSSFASAERTLTTTGGDKRPAQRRESRPLPPALVRRSAHDDQLILAALWQVFQEEMAQGEHSARPDPDPAFFDVMGLIYAASHSPDAPLLVRAGIPHASLYLLGEYLRMHDQLRQAVGKAITRGQETMRWNATNLLHRMQVVLDIFLRYHGWRSDGPLLVYPVVPNWDAETTRTFSVVVRIRDPEILMPPGDGVVPGRDDVRWAEESLAWVLKALFAHATELGLKMPVFW